MFLIIFCQNACGALDECSSYCTYDDFYEHLLLIADVRSCPCVAHCTYAAHSFSCPLNTSGPLRCIRYAFQGPMRCIRFAFPAHCTVSITHFRPIVLYPPRIFGPLRCIHYAFSAHCDISVTQFMPIAQFPLSICGPLRCICYAIAAYCAVSVTHLRPLSCIR
jgi:hypothetical protein